MNDLLVTGDALTGTGDALAVNGQGAPGPARLLVDATSPRVKVDAGSASLGETDGWVSVTLLRPGDTATPMTVHWSTVDDAAEAGVDCLAGSGSVTFLAGERQRTIVPQLLDNAELDEDRDLRLRLTGPGGSALPDVVLTIVNDDLGFVPHASGTTVNGRFLLMLTGQRGRTSLELQRSADRIHWEVWRRPFAGCAATGSPLSHSA
jgi:hypothetical protein